MITGLAHIAVFTMDIEKSIAFYEKLGGKLDKRDEAHKPTGINLLALVNWAGFTIELIEPHDGTVLCASGGAIPHLAVAVDDLDKAAAAVRAAGIDTFLTGQPNVLPNTFGGLKNWFFTGPSGEQIELLQML